MLLIYDLPWVSRYQAMSHSPMQHCQKAGWPERMELFFHTTWFQHPSAPYISGSLTKKNHDSGSTSTQTLSWGSGVSLNPQRFPMKNLNTPQWNPIFLWVLQLASVLQPSCWPLRASVVWILTSNSHHQLYRVIPLYPLDSFRFYFYLLQKHHNIVRFEWNFISKLSDFFQDLAFVPDFLKPVGEYWWCSDGESQDITG